MRQALVVAEAVSLAEAAVCESLIQADHNCSNLLKTAAGYRHGGIAVILDDLVSTRQSHSYSINGTLIELAIPPGVFAPSAYTLSLAGHIRVEPGERVAEIGTGSGIMAILAAKLGATVFATDISNSAIIAARTNADLNGVAIDIRQGDLFGDLNGPFDVIIANLPQARIEPDALKSLSLSLRMAIDGGVDGNAVLRRFLRTSLPHMCDRTRMYLSIDTETDYLATMSEMLERFDVQLLGVYSHELYDIINDSADTYRRLNELGRVCVFSKDGRLHGLQFVVELIAKNTETHTHGTGRSK